MADNEDQRAAQTPMRDLLANVASELESGWRAHSDAPDHMAGHNWGDEVSREVGRIIREALSRYRAGGEALTLADLRRANVERQSYWGGSDNWTLADWSNALAGEVGEACNVVKKIRRPQLGTVGNDADLPKYHNQLETEIGDVLIYLDLLAKAAGFSLDSCVSRAFNEKSEKLNMPVRLAPIPAQTREAVLEEAAKVMDHAAQEAKSHWIAAGRDEDAKSHYLWSLQTAEAGANAIRALASSPAPEPRQGEGSPTSTESRE